jgi:AcrR family transcriptional regulator
MMDCMSRATGRREANKLATRAALRQAAARLFAEQGYAATTVAQIAHEAQVGERTFYRYFDGKEDLLAERAMAWVDLLHDAIRDRPGEEGPYLATARAMTTMTRQLGDADDLGSLVRAEPAQFLVLLRRATPRPMRRLEEAIAVAIMERLDAVPVAPAEPPAPGRAAFQAHLIARVAVAALRTAAITYREQVRRGDRPPEFRRLLEDAFAQLPELIDGDWPELATG